MKRFDPQYDCVFLKTDDDVDKCKKWLDRLEDRLTSEIDALNGALKAFRERDPEETEPQGAVLFTMYHTTEVNAIPDFASTALQVKEQREHMREAVAKAKARLDVLADRVKDGQPVTFIVESVWYTFGYEYLFDPNDQKYGDSFSYTFFPYVWWDPYWFLFWPFMWF